MTQRVFSIPEPRRDEYGEVVEALSSYRERVSEQLPEMPHDVIDQWLYEHPHGMGTWDGLDLSLVRFSLEEWKISQMQPFETSVKSYRKSMEQSDRPLRTQNIVRYFEEHRSWPRPPILLENRGQIGLRWQSDDPYLLVQGHHRLAVFFHFRDHNLLNDKHPVWVARKVTEQVRTG